MKEVLMIGLTVVNVVITGVVLGVCIRVLYWVRHPVVKKVSSDLKLKPLAQQPWQNEDRNRDRTGIPPQGGQGPRDRDRGPRDQGPRDQGPRGDHGPRDGRDRFGQGGGDRDRGRDRGRDRDRNRGPRDLNRQMTVQGNNAADEEKQTSSAPGVTPPVAPVSESRPSPVENRPSVPPTPPVFENRPSPVENRSTPPPAAPVSENRPAPVENRPAPSAPPAPAPVRPASPVISQEIQHGRRPKLKNAPNFEELS